MVRGNQFPGGGAGPISPSINDDAITKLQAIAVGLSQLVQAFSNVIGNAGTVGRFTMPAAASLVVSNVNIRAASVVILTPVNAAAGTLQGSAKHLYPDYTTYVDGRTFTVKTASAAAAAGTEIFDYQIINVV